jgi:superfamily I DNA and RNA helicase
MMPGERNVYDHLLSLYKRVHDDREVFIIYDHPVGYSTNNPGRPDFILVDSKLGVSIIEVKDCKESSIKELTPTTIKYKGDSKESKSPVSKVDDYMNLVKGLLRDNGAVKASENISIHLSFTNIKVKSKTERFLNNQGKSGLSRLHFKKEFMKLSLEDIFYRKNDLGLELANKTVSIIRPYLVFEENDRVAAQKKRSAQISILDKKQLQAVSSPAIGHFMVTGIPGSGKSVAVINRALFLLTHQPDWKILVLCYNKPLSEKNVERIKVHHKRLAQMGLDPEQIEIKTFHKLCFDIAKKNNISLPKDKSKFDKSEQVALEYVEPEYDAVLIDEYQDFTDDWVKVAVGVAKFHTNKDGKQEQSLFLAGDRLQQIQTEGISSTWASLGINVISSKRSFLLKTSYRNCQKHLTVALEFLKSSKSLAREVDKFYEGDHDIHYELEEHPGEIQTSRSQWDRAYSDVESIITELLEDDVEPNEILVIAPKGKVLSELKESLKKFKIIPETPLRAKGLEAPYVFVVSTDYIAGSKKVSEINRRKLVYMLLTRSHFYTYLNAFKSDNNIVEEVFELINKVNLDEAA